MSGKDKAIRQLLCAFLPDLPDNIRGFLEELHDKGVQVEARVLNWERGKHGWIRDLSAVTPPLFVMGGFAEDALLFHRIMGQHADLDVLVIRHQLKPCLQQLEALGLVGLAADLVEVPGVPLVLDAGNDMPKIEVWVSASEPGGGYSFDAEGQPGPTRWRIFLPEDTFRYPATTIEGMAIQTVSPLALYQLRAISAMTRNSGEKRTKDLAMQERLLQAFLAETDEQTLRPRFVKL